jgi:hypothetical protein
LSFSLCSFLHSPFNSSSGNSNGASFDPKSSQKYYWSGFGTLWSTLVFVKDIHKTAILRVVCFCLNSRRKTGAGYVKVMEGWEIHATI